MDKYPYRAKSATAFIRRKLDKRNVALKGKGEPKTFNAYHFNVFVDFYNMKENEAYAYNLSLEKQPRWCYSQQAIDLMIHVLRSDPERAIDGMRAELAKRRRKSRKAAEEPTPGAKEF